MSTLKCDSIKSSDGNTDLLTLSNGSVSGVNLGRRNIIINGDFKVSQRGDYTSATTITTGNYYLDRWECISDVVTGTVLDNSDASVTLTATSSKPIRALTSLV